MTREKRKFSIWSVWSAVILCLLLLFLAYPLFMIIRQAFFNSDGLFSLENFSKFFSKSYYFSTIFNSVKIGASVTVCALILGTLLSYFYSFYRLKGARVLYIFCVLCTMSAPFLGAYSWVLMCGRNGIVTKILTAVFGRSIGSIYGFGGIVFVQSLKLFPLVFIYMNGAFKNIDNSLLEAAANLGCTGVKRFLRITMMLSMPTILAVALLVFMRSFSDFGVPLLIGEGYRTFTVELYNQYLGETGTNHNFAAAISVIAIIITALIFFLQKWSARKFDFSVNSLHPAERKRASGISGAAIHVFAYLLVCVAFLPQVYIIISSFRNYSGQVVKDGFSLNNYISAFQKGLLGYIWNTVRLGVSSLCVIIVLAIFIAYLVVRRKSVVNQAIDTLSMIPYIIPGSVIGIAMILAFNRKPLVLSGTVAIMVIAICVRRMPYTIRSSVAILQQIPTSLEEASISLGASKMKSFFRITVPAMSSGIISGAIMSWVAIITELSSAIILYNSKTITLTLATYININRGVDGVATACASVLTVLTALSLALYMFFSKDGEIKM